MPTVRWGVVLGIGLAVVVATAACEDAPFNRDVSDKLTITQGVYGQIIEQCDVNCDGQGAAGVAGFRVEVIEIATNSTLATVQSDADGLYQTNLPVGGYTICNTDAGRLCAPFNILQGSLIRLDFNATFPSWQ